MSKIIDKAEDGFKSSVTWLSQPFKTDELLLRLETLRDTYGQMRVNVTTAETNLSILVNELHTIQAKFVALAALTTEMVETIPPLEPDGLEADYQFMKDKYYDPLSMYSTISSAVGVVSFIPVGAVYTLKFLSGGSMFSNAVSGVGKMGKFLKGAKFLGKATLALALVLFIIETAIKFIASQKTNKELRGKIKELDEAITDLEKYEAKLAVKQEMAEEIKQQALDEAGVLEVSEFLIRLNEEISQVAEQAAFVRLARRMLRMGQTVDQVEPIFQDLSKEAVHAIDLRLKIETALIAGKTFEEVTEATGATGFQIGAVQRVLEVRSDAVLGYSDEVLAKRHKVSDAVADMQIDLVEDGLKSNWLNVLGDGDLQLAAEELLVPVSALNQLRAQIPVKVAMWENRDLIIDADEGNSDAEIATFLLEPVENLISSINSDFPIVPVERLQAMVDEVIEQKELLDHTKEITADHALIFRQPLETLSLVTV